MTTTKPDMARLLDALAFAANKHRDQRRKDSDATPYINHPIAVAQALCDGGVHDITTLQAAVLHDTVEDTDTTFAELEERVGPVVAAVVREVTDDKALDKASRKTAQVANAAAKSAAAAAVKVADKTCNLRDLRLAPPVHWDSARRKQYVNWALSVIGALPPTPAALQAAFHREVALLMTVKDPA
jgi:GTP diphosphokinase / guanosine-3',5'-bis(diphosphate) 3'-diphosphatase